MEPQEDQERALHKVSFRFSSDPREHLDYGIAVSALNRI